MFAIEQGGFTSSQDSDHEQQHAEFPSIPLILANGIRLDVVIFEESCKGS